MKILEQKTRSSEILTNYRFKSDTPDGKVFVIIDENSSGSPCYVHVHAGKGGNSLAAWACGTAALINELLKNGTTIGRVANILSNITTWDHRISSDLSSKKYAGPDCIKSAILQYIKIKYVESRDGNQE